MKSISFFFFPSYMGKDIEFSLFSKNEQKESSDVKNSSSSLANFLLESLRNLSISYSSLIEKTVLISYIGNAPQCDSC